MKIEKVKKSVANLHDKTGYVINIRNFKQALNHILVFKKVHREIKFKQNAWLKAYIEMNTDIKNKQKMILKKVFLSWSKMQFLETLWKMWEKLEILNLSQQKEEETV